MLVSVRSLAVAALVGLVPVATAGSGAPAPAHPDASVPAERTDANFVERHEAFLKRGKEGPIGVLFLGDSITRRWAEVPEIWSRYCGRYQPANFSIGGDTTQNVIWRIEHGELDGIHPRVVVLMIGTNNSASNTGTEIAAAVRQIVGMIRAKLPGTRVLLLAIFPRGPQKKEDGSVDDGVKRREAIHAANNELAKLDDGLSIRFLDIGPKFFGPDGRIPSAIMPDQLHLVAPGYQIWAEAMQPLLDEMMR
jgi:lysophospholipase L1-like esterase